MSDSKAEALRVFGLHAAVHLLTRAFRLLLQDGTYRSSVPMRVNLLLPPDFEQNGKGAVIRASFPQAQRWVASKVEGAEYTLWSTTLN